MKRFSLIVEHFLNVLRCNGIILTSSDFDRFVDLYLRMLVTLASGECDNTRGLDIVIDGSIGLDFKSPTDEDSENIQKFVIDVMKQSEHKMFIEGEEIIQDKDKLIEVFKYVQMFFATVIGFGKQFAADTYYSITAPFSYHSCCGESEEITIIGYNTMNGTQEFNVMSDVLFDIVPFETKRIKC